MRRRRTQGFTLAEIMITVVIIGLLAAIAVPTFISIKKRSQFVRFMNDARIFRDAIQTYYLDSGTLPIDSATGTLDAALQPYINPTVFGDRTPIGGWWDIEVNDSGIILGVGVVGYNLSPSELVELDARFDDGDLTTGSLRDIVAGSRFYVVIE